MNDLIKITKQEDGRVVVSARDVYDRLENTEGFSRWIKRMLDYGFVDNIDYQAVNIFVHAQNGVGGTYKTDYALTLDCAKQIGMLQRTPQGKKVRDYFIEAEKQLTESKKPVNVLDWLQSSLEVMKEQSKELAAIRHDVKMIDARTTTRPDFFAVSGYAVICNLSIGRDEAAKLGKQASAICKDYNIRPDKIRDPKWGYINSYPEWVLRQVFEKNGPQSQFIN
jgi:anti-repressor protein